MSTRQRMQSTGKETCPVCRDELEVHAIGQCNHPICFKCSTRMRVLCEQIYCAICRADMPKVVFVKEFQDFRKIDTRSFLLFRKCNLFFESDAIQDEFNLLIGHRCRSCRGLKPFRNFHQLEMHMRRDHGLFYCDLCVHNLTVFSQERKCYDRERLARHRRLGDADDMSYKGHPLCELCDQRFLDRDELAGHCRKEHFHCHFCETDGRLMEFFGDYMLLKNHFASDHYLCEEGECSQVQFTNAFRSDIDLKAHNAQNHSRGMKKAEARQARTLEFDIQLVPREGGSSRGHGKYRQVRHRDHDHDRDRDPHDRDRGGTDHDLNDDERRQREETRDRKRNFARKQREELASAHLVAASLNQIQRQSGSVAVVDKALLNQVATETARAQQPSDGKFSKHAADFPTLGASGTERMETGEDSDGSQKQGRSNKSRDTLAKKVALANNFSVQDGSLEEGDFPSLDSRSTAPKKAPSQPGKAWSLAADQSEFPSLSAARPKSNHLGSAGDLRTSNLTSGWVPPAVKHPTNNSKTPAPTPSWTKSSKPTGTTETVNMSQKLAPTNAKPSRSAPSAAMLEDFPSRPAPSAAMLEDFPSLSSIGNSLFTSLAGEQVSKLSVFRSPNSTVDSATSVPKQNPAPVKQPPVKFVKDDFPTLGKIEVKPSTAGEWVSKPAKDSPPVEKKQKGKKEEKPLRKQNIPVPSKPKLATAAPSKASPDKVDKKPKPATAAPSKASPDKVDKKPKPATAAPSKASADKVDQKPKPATAAPSKASADKVDRKPKPATAAPLKASADKVDRKPVPKEPDWEPPVAKRTVRAVAEEKQGKELENFIVQHTKNKKKKNKKSQKSTNTEESKSNNMSDHDSETEAVKPKVEAKSNANKCNKKEPVPKVHSMKEGKPALQPKIDNFPSLSELCETFPSSLLTDTVRSEDCPSPSSSTSHKPPPGFSAGNHPPKAPSTTSRPPPGFSTVTSSSSMKKPPPGFGKPAMDNIENVAPLLTNGTPTSYSYVQPARFKERNQQLIQEVKTLLTANQFEKFKSYSGEFRQALISASDYYKKCCEINAEAFKRAFPELLVLLPDIDKQQMLLAAYKDCQDKNIVKISKKMWNKNAALFNTCPTCRQVVSNSDFTTHASAHNSDRDFPTLGSVAAMIGLDVGIKS